MRRLIPLTLLCASASFTMGARGCDDDLPVGRMGEDAGPADPMTEDGGAPAETDAGPTVVTDAGTPPADAGDPASVTRMMMSLGVGVDDIAYARVTAWDGPAASAGGSTRTVMETFGPCEAAHTTPGTSGTGDSPETVDLGPGAVEVRVAGGPTLRPVIDHGSYVAEIAPAPAAGTEVEMVVRVPGGPTIRRTLVLTDIELVEPAVAERYPELPVEPSWYAEYDEGADFDVTWVDIPGGYGDVMLVLHASTDITGAELNDIICTLDYDDVGVRVPWSVFAEYIVPGAEIGDAGFILFNDALRETETVGDIELTTNVTAAVQVHELRSTTPSMP